MIVTRVLVFVRTINYFLLLPFLSSSAYGMGTLCRKTIKQNNVSLKCFRFVSNLETGESLRGFVSYNLYATSPTPRPSSVVRHLVRLQQ